MKESDKKELYEVFCDVGYYHMWCVRCVDDRRFESPKSFHFNKMEDAQEFHRLIMIAK